MSMDKGKAPLIEEGHEGSEYHPTFVTSRTAESGNFGETAPIIRRFGHDVSMTPENHQMSIGHNQIQSEHSFPCLSTEHDEDVVSMYFDVDKFPSSLDDLGLAGNEMTAKAVPSHGQAANPVTLSDVDRQSIRLRRSHSIDGSPSDNLDELASSLECLPMSASRKFKSAARLAEAILVDPLRARRMISNRQSAARSREKGRYVVELEQKVESLQKEATALSAHLSHLNRRNNALASENQQLKVHQQKLEKDMMLKYAMVKNLQEELQRLKFEMAQFVMNGRPQVGLHSLQQQFLQQPQQPCSAMTNEGLISSQSHSLGNSDDGSSSNE